MWNVSVVCSNWCDSSSSVLFTCLCNCQCQVIWWYLETYLKSVMNGFLVSPKGNRWKVVHLANVSKINLLSIHGKQLWRRRVGGYLFNSRYAEDGDATADDYVFYFKVFISSQLMDSSSCFFLKQLGSDVSGKIQLFWLTEIISLSCGLFDNILRGSVDRSSVKWERSPLIPLLSTALQLEDPLNALVDNRVVPICVDPN